MLITLDALRADQVTGPELTPNLAAFMRQADWAGRAVAASSRAVPAMASLFTGLSAWQHHTLLEEDARLASDLITLPKAFKALGYRTTALVSGRWYSAENGYDRGFDTFDEVGRNRDAAEHLASLGEGRELVWIHLPEPQAPYIRRDWLLPRIGAARGAGELPRVVEPLELERWSDPAAPPSAALRQRMAAMYRLNVAWADEKVGRLLEALRDSGQWDRALVIVTAPYGEELGEHGRLGHGADLEREALEVPLIVKLPNWYPRALPKPGQGRAAVTQIWSTLVEAAGGHPPPAMAPSLFHGLPEGVLSDLYFADGVNLFSWVEGNDQLTLTARFAVAEPRYYRARFEALAGTAKPGRPDGFSAIAERFFAAYTRRPPRASDAAAEGAGPAGVELERWGAAGETHRIDDPARVAFLARRLASGWADFVNDEGRSPEEEDRSWVDQLPP